MVVPQEVLDKARAMLASAKHPLFLHDDDCDGTSSFVLCYQFCGREGKSVPVKRSPCVTTDFLRSVRDYEADLVVVLDKPKVDRDFLIDTKLPVLWIDHHEPQRDTIQGLSNVHYVNPRMYDDTDNRPTVSWCYKITGKSLWLAVVGCIADYHLPDYLEEFKQQYPALLPATYTKVEDLYLDTPVGKIIQVIQFNLKGMSTEAKKSVLTLTRIDDPYEILEQRSARGKFLWKKYERLASGYEALLARARALPDGPILLFIYEDDLMTFTSELSNELLIRYPQRITLVGRHHDGAYKCSLRSRDVELPPIIDECLKGLDGYGGGHKFACGLYVAEKDWAVFCERFSAAIAQARGQLTKTANP
jgi:single-stranded DNA-specific DHH superfamily exonuclease